MGGRPPLGRRQVAQFSELGGRTVGKAVDDRRKFIRRVGVDAVVKHQPDSVRVRRGTLQGDL